MSEAILSLSYGKDSLACIEAIHRLNLPLDRIIHAEVWATEDIPAEFPNMVEFKAKADRIIKERWGITVEHYCAKEKDGSKRSFESIFYRKVGEKAFAHRSIRYYEGTGRFQDVPLGIYGFPLIHRGWCNSHLKMAALSQCPKGVSYIGIAADEKERIARHQGKEGVRLPLVEIGWSEADCRKWCEENDLLSPIYTESARGGCWFCPCQGLDQLRKLYHNYPNLWELLLKWDKDSPISFKPNGLTVAQITKRFEMEDQGLLDPKDRHFRWAMLTEDYQLKIIF